MQSIPNTNPALVILAVECTTNDYTIVTTEMPVVGWLVDEETLRAPDAIPVTVARVPLRWAILDKTTGHAYGAKTNWREREDAIEELADLARMDARSAA
ncbi:hypothetical protein [Thiocapsa roseopersicina]|uniref:Uncharacterized protein n=1 Tax=Thiocapsa roseopersicina TaxID=1058 RepID=A0A1H3CPZ5_THIRO|nr:hypothetical protein [Thiocapsa roseopersicina]SDX55499.1 hypothetical protein SAMN05421783_1362 [Thiocapsa roseopersicina]